MMWGKKTTSKNQTHNPNKNGKGLPLLFKHLLRTAHLLKTKLLPKFIYIPQPKIKPISLKHISSAIRPHGLKMEQSQFKLLFLWHRQI